MTKPNSSVIAVVMDRSGSMGDLRKETISGFNSFLQTQKAEPGECKMFYSQFDDFYDIVHNFTDLKDVPELTEETYVPRGYTALRDAIGRTINIVGKRLADMKEEERPSNVIFVIQTDGIENASREFTWDQVKEMIKKQTDEYSWNFLFFGAGPEAFDQAEVMGVSVGASMNYAASPTGTQALFASASANVSHARATGQTRDFTDEEREEASRLT